jgi:hypothetical protein
MDSSKMYYIVLQNKPYFLRLRGLVEACCVKPGKQFQASRIPVHRTVWNSTWLPGFRPGCSGMETPWIARWIPLRGTAAPPSGSTGNRSRWDLPPGFHAIGLRLENAPRFPQPDLSNWQQQGLLTM